MMSTSPKTLTTVSYEVLGLLALKPHSPYELARQVERLAVFWASAESVVYTEPKNLVAHGLARAATSANGRRARTVYSITPAGRRALRAWLASPTEGPRVQFEGMLKVLFAGAGTKTELLAAIDAIEKWAATTRIDGEGISTAYLHGNPPYPDRAHIVALTVGYQVAQVAAVQQWVAWARAQIDRWEGTGPQPTTDLRTFEEVVAGRNPVADGRPATSAATQ
jgi:DNA-binding PadR family transcriptional regulator